MAAPRKKKAKKDTSFATWKFDLENTVNADPLADGPCLKLMRAYLDWMSSPDTRPYLSIISLKVSTSLHEGAISRARALLVKLGYFVPDGTTSTGAVRYKIVNARRNVVLDHQLAARETLRELEAEKKKKVREKRRGSAVIADPVSPAETADLNGKWLCDFEGDSSAVSADNYVEYSVEAYSKEREEHLKSVSSDALSCYSSANFGDEQNQPLPIPRNDIEAETMMDAICHGRDVTDYMRGRLKSMLQAGVLTPRMADNIIGIKTEAAA